MKNSVPGRKSVPDPRTAVLVLGCILVCCPAVAEIPLPQATRLQSSPVLRHLVPNPVVAGVTQAAAATLKQMHVPAGFRVDLIAAEPEVRQPVAFAWDERGRLWVAEAHSYPTRRPAGQGLDRLVILEDRDGDGAFETRTVFTERLNLVSGFEVGHGGVWVGAAPELLFIPDRNRDDRPDGPPEVLLDGFGFQDTHECLNSFLWGPDGWLYGIQGVFNLAHIGRPGAPDAQRVELRAGVWRYHPTRRVFEVFANGGSNPWGLDYDEHGELFMTHCRSYWGRGGTTHVIQNGHFWNQANANYAPFIIANPPAGFPEYRNFLLASARYDHGAGGAGEPGSDAIYGGHAHVGTMLYYGDNWPEQYRGQLFTHNLHGHQMNRQVNRREGSGYNTVHAGSDQLFCTDPRYVAIDLQYGPDGAVYFIDWYDQQHCHNPNSERWERGSGRIYRMQWQETWRPAKVILAAKPDTELVDDLGHRNEWFARTAQRLLQERAAGAGVSAVAADRVVSLARSAKPATLRLRALWTAAVIGRFDRELARTSRADDDEFVRAWSLRLATERDPSMLSAEDWTRLARGEASAVVRRQMASLLPALPAGTAWPLAEILASRTEDRADRNLPALLWQGMAERIGADPVRGFALARSTVWPALADWIHWYAATRGGGALDRAVAELETTPPDALLRRLAGLLLAVEPRGRVARPASWDATATRFYNHGNPRVRRATERVAAVFGDETAFPRLRGELTAPSTDAAVRPHAFAVLSRGPDPASLPAFLALLDDNTFRPQVLAVLARYDSPDVSAALLSRLAGFNAADRSSALNTLTRRPTYAVALLDAVAAGRVKRDLLTAYHVRQLAGLHQPEVDRRLAASWGRFTPTAGAREAQLASLEKTFNEAPLWAYSAAEGRGHFLKLCAACHVLGRDGTRLGPELTGAGRNGIRYFLENIIDPNAVVGVDYQMTNVETRDGEVVSGLKEGETPESVSLRTTQGPVVVRRDRIVQQATSPSSLMPEGLLESLGDRERLELLKYLIQN